MKQEWLAVQYNNRQTRLSVSEMDIQEYTVIILLTSHLLNNHVYIIRKHGKI